MRVLGTVIKSKSDNRIYKAIQLKNQIECLIISDAEAKKSSAALSVNVGSLGDPFEAQGLAHYLEHMLFMGTKKYPTENDYSQVPMLPRSSSAAILGTRTQAPA
jgi:insulysin